MDQLPEAAAPPAAPAANATKEKRAPPEIKLHFVVVSNGPHTVGGRGAMRGKVMPCTFYACKQSGLHHNWKYPFLRPTNEAVVKRYKQKFHTTVGDAPPAAAPDAAAGAAAAEPAEAAAGAP